MRLGEAKELAQGHAAGKWQRWDPRGQCILEASVTQSPCALHLPTARGIIMTLSY